MKLVTPFTLRLLSGEMKEGEVSALLKVLYWSTDTVPSISKVSRYLHSRKA